MTRCRLPWLAFAFPAVLTACSPTLNWRDAQPEGSAVRLSFPCKPASRSRDVVIAGKPVAMQLHSCDAGDATFALTVADVADPALVAPILAGLKLASARNIDATSTLRAHFSIKGMTPSGEDERLMSVGHLPDGSGVRQEAAFFTLGTRVYQATILSKADRRLEADAADTFFGSVVPSR